MFRSLTQRSGLSLRSFARNASLYVPPKPMWVPVALTSQSQTTNKVIEPSSSSSSSSLTNRSSNQIQQLQPLLALLRPRIDGTSEGNSRISDTPFPKQIKVEIVEKGQSRANFELQLEELEDMLSSEDKTLYLDSVMRKRRLKMKKHKLRKRRKAQRALKRRLGKI